MLLKWLKNMDYIFIYGKIKENVDRGAYLVRYLLF